MLTAMVFSGGLGLSSFHAGAYQTFREHGLTLDWVTGSSAGAVTAALVAGQRRRKPHLPPGLFWQVRADEPVFDHPFTRLQAYASVAQGHLVGHLDFFHRRSLFQAGPSHSASFQV